MHIPDGFLDPRLCLGTAAVSGTAIAASLRRVRPEAEPDLPARMGVTAAYVFAAQMINFPVAAGTSGHLLGGVLAAVLLGPHAASVVMAAVFLIQAFFFLDGGHTALGANVLNMGLAGTFGGWAVYRALAGPAPDAGRCARSAAVAAWIAVMLGASFTAAELALSRAIPARRVFPVMLSIHAFIGIGEALITAGALSLVWRVRPDLLTGKSAPGGAGRRWATAAAAGLACVAALAPLASSAPDGLEWVAERLGFAGRGRGPLLAGPFPDYSLPGLEAGWFPIVISLLGAGLVLGALLLVGRLARRDESVGRAELHGVDARVKLAAMLALVVSAVATPAAAAGRLWLLLGVAVAGACLARTSARWLASRALLLVPFVGLAALALPQAQDGAERALPLYGLAFLRAAVSFFATAAFAGGTPEPEILTALSSAGVPPALGLTLSFAVRYLRVLGEEGGRMLQARSARTVGGGTLALRAGVTGAMVGSLFIRSFERAERISRAMECRGYRPGAASYRPAPLDTRDRAFAVGFALLLLGVWLWR